MSLIGAEIRHEAHEQMAFRQAEFETKIAIRSGRTKVGDIQPHGKRGDAMRGKPIPLHQFALRFVSPRDHHHIEQMAVEKPRHQIAIQGSGDMPDSKQLRPGPDQSGSHCPDPTVP